MFILEEDVYGLFPTTPSQLPFIDPDSQSPSNITQTLAQKPGSTANLQMFKEINSRFRYFDFSIDPKKFAPMMSVICPEQCSHFTPPWPGSRPGLISMSNVALTGCPWPRVPGVGYDHKIQVATIMWTDFQVLFPSRT